MQCLKRKCMPGLETIIPIFLLNSLIENRKVAVLR